MKKYIGEIGLFTVAIIWGSGLIAAKVSLNSVFLTSQIMTFRFFISAVLLNLIFFKQIKDNLSKGILKAGSILGICLFLGFFLQTVGLKYTTPSKNAFLTSVNVVIVPFIGLILYKRKLDKFGVASRLLYNLQLHLSYHLYNVDYNGRNNCKCFTNWIYWNNVLIYI